MIKQIFLAGSLLLAGSPNAQTMYKCQVDGKIEYSGMPCAEGVELKRLAPDGGATPEDRARAQMHAKAERERLDAQARAEASQRKHPSAAGDPLRPLTSADSSTGEAQKRKQ